MKEVSKLILCIFFLFGLSDCVSAECQKEKEYLNADSIQVTKKRRGKAEGW